MNDLAPMVIVPAIIYGVYAIFELYARRKERLAIIDKLSEGIDPQLLTHQMGFLKVENKSTWAIKIGCLLLGVGLGLFICSIVEFTAKIPNNWDTTERNALSAMYGAATLLFGGVGLVSSYFIERKFNKKDKD